MSTSEPSRACARSAGRRRLWGLSIAHILADGYGSFPAPLLRTLADSLGVSYASASALVGLNGLWVAVGNVVTGLGTDRWKHLGSATIVVSAALTVVSMSLIGVVPGYGRLAAVMLVGMLACGAFHPPGFTHAGDASHPNRHRGVSVVMAAGIAACGLGPVFVGLVVSRGGLRATPWCMAPGLLLAALALRFLRRAPADAATRPRPAAAPVSAAVRASAMASLALLFANSGLRAFCQVGMTVIVSELTETSWGLSVAASGFGIGALYAGAGLGGLLGSAVTREGDERRVLLGCVPLGLAALLPLAGSTGAFWYAWVSVFGLAMNAPGSLAIGMAQRLAPNRSAFVSGLIIGPVGAIGGFLASVMTPIVLRRYGQAATMAFMAVPVALSAVFAWPLPRQRAG